MKALRLGLPLWALVSASLFNCSGDKAPARGQIMLALQTDLALPQDINRVRLQVMNDQGKVEFDRTFTVGAKGQAKIPATFAIVAPEGRPATVEVRVIGFSAQGPRTFNKVITTVPKDRIATLRMPIQWLCDKSVIDLGNDSYESNCAPIGDEEAACRAGTCQKVSVREDSLPDFAAPDVFGGGKDPEDPDGECFDTVACFNLGLAVEPDAQCRVQLSAPAALPINFALRSAKPDEGICGAAHDCYVPLDKSELFGWTELTSGSPNGAGGAENGGAGGEGGAPELGGNGKKLRTFQLPPAVCEKIGQGVIASVQATGVCETKTERLPVCGDWYSDVVKPVAPMMSGGGSGNDACTEFKPGSRIGIVTGEPVFDGTIQVAADLKVAIDDLTKSTFNACAGVIDALGGDAPALPSTLTGAAVKEVCDTASTALKEASRAAAGSSWSVLLAAAQCGISIDEVATCESTCKGMDCGALEKAYLRCDDLGVSCSISCNGDCGGSEASPVQCEGTCKGVCSGSCTGDCIREDGSIASGACNGWCTGSCEGTCAGSCSAETKACDGTCWGECSGTSEDMLCRVALREERCLGTCGALCAAETALEARCTQSSAKLYGVAPDALRKAIDSHYAALADAVARSATISAAINSAGSLYASFSMADDGSNKHASACLASAGNALASASSLLTSTLDAASKAASSVTPGTGSGCTAPERDCGGTCVNVMTDPANCGDCGVPCATGASCDGGVCRGGMTSQGGAGSGGESGDGGAGADTGGSGGASAGTANSAGNGNGAGASSSSNGGTAGSTSSAGGTSVGGGAAGAASNLICPADQPAEASDCTGFSGPQTCLYGEGAATQYCFCQCPPDAPSPCKWHCTLG